MAIMSQMLSEAYNVIARSDEYNTDATPVLIVARQQTSTAPSPAPSPNRNNNPTSSPLLFFVALGFGVVFTNLWIIVGVKYCFRYNARNRALRNGEDVDQINMENMPTRPHRRRKEKKLMTMDEVNERFPLTKYKTWVAARLSAGLPTAGGVAGTTSRPGSVRNVDGAIPASPVETKQSVDSRPVTASPDPTPNPTAPVVTKEQNITDKDNAKPVNAPANNVAVDEAYAPALTKQVTGDDDDDDDHIHTAVPPELLTNPGDSCAICIDTLEDDDDIRGLTCGHAFHAGCLDPWLTSRRACCPLCKADYFTPKPRPEGEAPPEAERSTRRRGEPRMNLPQEPRSAWAGFRGSPRMIFASRSVTVDRAQSGNDSNGSRPAQDATPATSAPEVTEPAAPSQNRWRNPFNRMRRPGQNQAGGAPENPTTEPSPSQLEAGTANTTTVR